MQNSEKFCLKWNDFQENLNYAFGELRNDMEFSDVTLACEDGTQIEAHKIILATSSPFFKEILKGSKHPHPLIYMRGLKAEELTAAVDFLYFGKANVLQENLDAFLALAEELRLKGLTGSVEDKESKYEEPPQNNIASRKQHKELIRNMPAPKDIQHPHLEEEVSSEMPLALVSDGVSALNEQVKSLMDFSENRLNSGSRLRICKVCGKEGQAANIMTHIAQCVKQ